MGFRKVNNIFHLALHMKLQGFSSLCSATILFTLSHLSLLCEMRDELRSFLLLDGALFYFIKYVYIY